ncbi:homoserine kinase [Terriglobus tenax]|uniref:homoserine kinase n=1 Tax=Terriglobus tenax TaxID=1111115 RepID=UPI0021E0E16D|nr:homoserine kinase [Terriglobus tenax]
MTVSVRVPASSANLGPGFDALGMALAMYLEIEAEVSEETSIAASGRDAHLCGRLDRNLILSTIFDLLSASGRSIPGLKLTLKNEIPLGRGCGSSAAAIVAAVLLANELGQLGWDEARLLREVSRIEGHPDNVAAALLGGVVASAMQPDGEVAAVKIAAPSVWQFLVAIPSASLSTSKARGMLPDAYSKADTIFNVQRSALLMGAFAAGRGDLLRLAMQDRMHQPYRMEACPLLKALLPMSGKNGVLGVALSGAGPSVLLVLDKETDPQTIIAEAQKLSGDPGLEVVVTAVAEGAVSQNR